MGRGKTLVKTIGHILCTTATLKSWRRPHVGYIASLPFHILSSRCSVIICPPSDISPTPFLHPFPYPSIDKPSLEPRPLMKSWSASEVTRRTCQPQNQPQKLDVTKHTWWSPDSPKLEGDASHESYTVLAPGRSHLCGLVVSSLDEFVMQINEVNLQYVETG